MNLGRNDPCHCGSGKKLKHCHGDPRSAPTGPSIALLRRAREHFARQEADELQRVKDFGEIKPLIAAENWGKRIVAVRNRLYWGKWKYFPDFLDYFVQARFGSDWTTEQNNLGSAEKHPITQWRTRALLYRERILGGEYIDQGVRPNGYMAAYFGFAYDLYVVDNNNNLDDRVLERLTNREQFQGARHELFAEATCLRAGFTVSHEDETDRKRRHVEFVATDKKSGIRLAVEAKSRHRPGVIAQPGTPRSENEADFKFSRLINDAVAKDSSLPLALFLDTNLPPARARQFYGQPAPVPEPTRYLRSIIDDARKRKGGRDPYNLLIFTNFPHHYGHDDDLDPQRDWIAYIPSAPALAADTEPLWKLISASELYGNVPNTFPAQAT